MLIQDVEKDLKDGGDADKKGGSDSDQSDKAQDLAKIQEQITNLNKGIATSREEARVAKAEADKLKEQLAQLQDKNKPEDEVELHPEDMKKLEAWAKKQGLVTQKELEAQKAQLVQESTRSMAQTAVDEFLAKHKEYDDDAKWQALQKEFALYKMPTTITEYRKILNRIHKDISGDDEEEAEARAKAKQANTSRLKLGGGSQSSSPAEQTVEDLQKKYPHLSKEMIEQRLADLKALQKK